MSRPICLIILPSSQKDRQLESFLLASKDIFEVCVISLDANEKWLSQLCKELSLRFISLESKGLLTQVVRLTRTIFSYPSPVFVCSHTYSVGKLVALVRLITLTLPGKHFSWLHFRHHNLLHKLLLNRKASLIDYMISLLCDYQAVPSKECADTLVAEGCIQRKILLHRHYIDLAMLDNLKFPPIQEKKNYALQSKLKVIAVGRVDWQKNYPFLLDVIQILCRKFSLETHIFGVGNSDEIKALEENIRTRGLETIVKYRGNSEDIHQLMLEHDLMLHFSRDESFGLAVAEALILGVPVISSNAGSLTIFNALTIFQVDEFDATLVARKISNTLLSNAILPINPESGRVQQARQEFGRKTIEIIEHHKSVLNRFRSSESSL